MTIEITLPQRDILTAILLLRDKGETTIVVADVHAAMKGRYPQADILAAAYALQKVGALETVKPTIRPTDDARTILRRRGPPAPIPARPAPVEPLPARPAPTPAPGPQEVAPEPEAAPEEPAKADTASIWETIAADLRAHPGSCSRDIADRVGLGRNVVSLRLSDRFRGGPGRQGLLTQDKSQRPARWTLAADPDAPPPQAAPPAPPARPDPAPPPPPGADVWEIITSDLRENPWSSAAEVSLRTGISAVNSRFSSWRRTHRARNAGLVEDRSSSPIRWAIGVHSAPTPEPAVPGPAPAPRHATAERARQALWDALQPGEDRGGLTVLGLAQMAVEQLQAIGEVLDDAGAPAAPTLAERVRWLAGELVAAQNRARAGALRAEIGEAHAVLNGFGAGATSSPLPDRIRQLLQPAPVAAPQPQPVGESFQLLREGLQDALGVARGTTWGDLLDLARQRSRPLADQLAEVARQHEVRAAIIAAACGELRGAA